METNEWKKESFSSAIRRDENGDYCFGSFVFCPEEMMLWRYGVRVKITAQSAAVLRKLLEARRHFLSKQKLAALCRSGKTDSDEAVRQRLVMAVSRLRRALRADPSVQVACESKRSYGLLVACEKKADGSGGKRRE